MRYKIHHISYKERRFCRDEPVVSFFHISLLMAALFRNDEKFYASVCKRSPNQHNASSPTYRQTGRRKIFPFSKVVSGLLQKGHEQCFLGAQAWNEVFRLRGVFKVRELKLMPANFAPRWSLTSSSLSPSLSPQRWKFRRQSWGLMNRQQHESETGWRIWSCAYQKGNLQCRKRSISTVTPNGCRHSQHSWLRSKPLWTPVEGDVNVLASIRS